MADDPLRWAGGGEANSVIVWEDLMITVGQCDTVARSDLLCGAERMQGGRRDSAPVHLWSSDSNSQTNQPHLQVYANGSLSADSCLSGYTGLSLGIHPFTVPPLGDALNS